MEKETERRIESLQKQVFLNSNRCFSLLDRVDQIFVELDQIKGQLTILTSILQHTQPRSDFISADKLLKKSKSKKEGI